MSPKEQLRSKVRLRAPGLTPWTWTDHFSSALSLIYLCTRHHTLVSNPAVVSSSMFELISLVFDSQDSFTDVQIILTHLAYPITLLGDVGRWGSTQGCLPRAKAFATPFPHPRRVCMEQALCTAGYHTVTNQEPSSLPLPAVMEIRKIILRDRRIINKTRNLQ